MSLIPVAKINFFAVNSSPFFVMISKPFAFFFPLTASAFENFTVGYCKTCFLAFSAITLGFSPSCVMKLWEWGVCLLQGNPLSIIKTFRMERPKAMAAESPA
jgi:hypothetical protein